MDNVRALEAILVWQRAIDTFGRPADRHADLLARYQVRPEETLLWPHGAAGWLAEQAGFEPRVVTRSEAALLDRLVLGPTGPAELIVFNDIKERAEDAAEARFPGQGQEDGHGDAFRHAYWNALMAQRYGEQWASDFATAHERNPTSHPVPVAMDLHNNELGRGIARDHPGSSPEELAGLVEQAVREGRTVVVDRTDTLVPSVPGESRVTNKDNPWPTNNPGRSDDTVPPPVYGN